RGIENRSTARSPGSDGGQARTGEFQRPLSAYALDSARSTTASAAAVHRGSWAGQQADADVSDVDRQRRRSGYLCAELTADVDAALGPANFQPPCQGQPFR